MKKFKLLISALVFCAAALSLNSCIKDDNKTKELTPEEISTAFNSVKGDYSGKAITRISTGVNDKVRNVWVNWIDTVRTKSMAQAMAVDSATVGNDPVEIVKDWSTVCEDGYLTLRFRTYMSGYTQHKMNLVATSNPYEVRLYHDACGDRSTRVADGVVAFRLDKLPDTQGKTVDLTLKWKSFSGEKSVKFKYRTRK